ncbi:MAG: hypothetical protein JJT89_01770 [Nitriliruptoraceae bacterium]|nr:hypothetical protein [Nitriliruptoraceae bacterium]
MLEVSANVVLMVAVIGGAGLGWLVASRRHPAYVVAFSFLVLGIAGLVIASLPSYLSDGFWGQDMGNALLSQMWASRISWVVGAASVAFALAAGLRALWAAPRSVSPTATDPDPASHRVSSSAAEAQ